jgi:hypothetical protein
MGWQCKHIARLDKAQLTRSVEAALAIHPRLERYVICLPFDLGGPTARPGADQLTRWDTDVGEWQALAGPPGSTSALNAGPARSCSTGCWPSTRRAAAHASGLTPSG